MRVRPSPHCLRPTRPAELLQLAIGYEAVIADASASGCPALSSRPSPETWSILEYTGHVEFIYGSVGQMCEIADPDELAPINGVDPDEHVDNAHFNEAAPMEMSAANPAVLVSRLAWPRGSRQRGIRLDAAVQWQSCPTRSLDRGDGAREPPSPARHHPVGCPLEEPSPSAAGVARSLRGCIPMWRSSARISCVH